MVILSDGITDRRIQYLTRRVADLHVLILILFAILMAEGIVIAVMLIK